MPADADPRLVLAALAEPELALPAWEEWREATPQSTAPAILSWAGGYIRRNLLRAGVDDPWLRGIHRHNWMANNRRIVRVAPLLRALNERFGLVPLKSLAQSVDGETRGLRPVADVDVFLPMRHLEAAGREIEALGYTGMQGASAEEVATRIARRGGSWNFVDAARSDVDLHWRLFEHVSVAQNQLLVWEDVSVRDSFFGPCPQLSAELLCLHVAVHYWSDPALDRYHGMFDFASVAGRCDAAAVWRLADRLEVSGIIDELNGYVGAIVGRSPLGAGPPVLRRPRPRLERTDPRTVAAERVARGVAPALRPNPDIPERREPERLRHPALYRAWTAAGRPALAERLAVRLGGPLSAVAKAPPSCIVFSPRDVTHPFLGPGWNVQYELDEFRWTDGPDARVVLDSGPRRTGRRLEIDLDRWSWSQSTVRHVDVAVNGRVVGACGPEASRFSFAVPPQVRPGVVEVSLRGCYALAFADIGPGMHFFRLGLPVRSIAVVSPVPRGAAHGAGAGRLSASATGPGPAPAEGTPPPPAWAR